MPRTGRRGSKRKENVRVVDDVAVEVQYYASLARTQPPLCAATSSECMAGGRHLVSATALFDPCIPGPE
jgi:hypothetical protein